MCFVQIAEKTGEPHSLGEQVKAEVPMFAPIIQRFRRLIRDESGPTAVEYAVMLALIITVVIGSVSALGGNSNRTFQSAAQALDTKTDGNQDGNGQY